MDDEEGDDDVKADVECAHDSNSVLGDLPALSVVLPLIMKATQMSQVNGVEDSAYQASPLPTPKIHSCPATN